MGSMTRAERKLRTGWPGLVARQLLLLTLFAVVACLGVILSLPVKLPIGPMFWDVFIYLDAANRIADHQVPAVDFFAPAGALGYYLFTFVHSIWPAASPLLSASWSIVLVSAPLMALILIDMQKRSPLEAWLVLAPYLYFSVLPFNTAEFSIFPGSDGFGIYNRQICQLLYVLSAALVFVRNGRWLAIITGTAMLSLVLVKITGLAAGGLLCLTAFFAGRLPLRYAFAAGGVFLLTLLGLQLTTGIVEAYGVDMLRLLMLNDSSLLPRILQAGSMNAGLLFPAILLCGLLFFEPRASSAQSTHAGSADIRLHPLWLVVFVIAGLLFESQNTGSQAFIFLWPLLLNILMATYHSHQFGRYTVAVTVLIAAISLPPVVLVAQKAARAYIGALTNTTLMLPNLESMGAVNVRQKFIDRMNFMQATYIAHRDVYSDIARSGTEAPNGVQSDLEFQIGWLKTANDTVSALLAFERTNKLRFETLMSVDFINPYPWLLDRHAPRYIAVGAVPGRSVVAPDERVRQSIAAVDVAFYQTCPPTALQAGLWTLYGPILSATHSKIALTPCMDAYVRTALMPKPALVKGEVSVGSP